MITFKGMILSVALAYAALAQPPQSQGSLTVRIVETMPINPMPCPVAAYPACSLVVAITSDSSTVAFRITVKSAAGITYRELTGAYGLIPACVFVPVDVKSITSVVVEELKAGTPHEFRW